MEALFEIIRDKMDDLSHNHVIAKNKFKVKAFGNLDMLPGDVREAIRQVRKGDEHA